MNVHFLVEGADKTHYHVQLLSQKVRNELQRVMSSEVLIITTRAKQILTENRHIVTGNLRRSIQGKSGWASFEQIDGIIGTDVHYAPYIEALPDGGYLYPALRQKQREVVENIRRRMKAILDGGRG